MKKTSCFYAILWIAILFSTSTQAQVDKEIKYTKIWETPQSLKIPESVLFHARGHEIFVANINGKSSEKDGNGFISKLKETGEIKTLEWITGLNAPKGMGIFKNKLYVTDIDEIVEIDISNGTIIKKYPAKESKFLNDISIDAKGTVYVSDMASKSIYRLKNDTFKLWLFSDKLESPNGLLCEKNSLLIGTKNGILSADYKSKELKVLVENTGSIDGLVSAGNGGYLFSNWAGAVYYVKPGSAKVLIFDHSKDKINAADIDFIKSKNILLVPTFLDNRIVSYKLEF